jgi:ATP-binding cassette, subfamily B, bacterial
MIGPFKRLLGYAAPYRARLWRASILSVLNKIADLAPPVLIGVAVDIVIKGKDSLLGSWGITDPFEQLVWLAVVTVVVWALESIFEYAFQCDWRNLAQEIQHELRLNTYSHIQHLDIGWFKDRKSGRLMSIINDDVNQLERFLNGGANDILQVATTAICVSAVFFYFSPSIALLSMLPIPIILWGSFLFQKRIAPRYAEVRERASQVNSQLANNLAGIETVKSFTAEDREVDVVDRLSRYYKESNAKAIKLSSAFSPLIRMAIVVGFVATLIYGGKLTLDGQMEVGVYSVLVFLTQRLLWPLTRLGATFDLYQRAMASTERVLDLLETRSAINDGDQSLEKVRGEITLDNITFTYTDREEILQNFSLHIAAGQTMAVVGPTGSGKSTLVRLLLRFYDPKDGRVLLDGKDISSLKLDSLRSAIGLVSQGVYLFDGTIKDNILYGRPNSSIEEVIEAAKAAEIHSFIDALQDGYDTRIGERGVKLSGGQRQRVSIARAILKDPPILILDEATSAVDNETEAAIQRSLEKIALGRTTIVIAHRLSTIRNADQVLVMDRGQIVAQGSHDELVRESGLYARLWKVQTGILE